MLCLLASPFAAFAQQTGTTVIQSENVSYDYAHVMRVTPVYQTLRATSVEERCDPPAAEDASRLERVVDRVKGALGRDSSAGESTGRNCRSVPVEREYRRPIAYDVDYAYKGEKFRSRLAEDPGNRLRIRVSVTPAPPPPRGR